MKYLGTRSKQYDPVVTQDISGKQDKATLEQDVAAKGLQKILELIQSLRVEFRKLIYQIQFKPLLEKRTLHYKLLQLQV